MLIAYRPELENPPREGGFGIITDGGMIQLTPGLNQDVPESQWKIAQENAIVKKVFYFIFQVALVSEILMASATGRGAK